VVVERIEPRSGSRFKDENESSEIAGGDRGRGTVRLVDERVSRSLRGLGKSFVEISSSSTVGVLVRLTRRSEWLAEVCARMFSLERECCGPAMLGSGSLEAQCRETMSPNCII
jgi:hypothetical protein